MKIYQIKSNFDSIPPPHIFPMVTHEGTSLFKCQVTQGTYSGCYSLGKKMSLHCWILTCNFLEFALKFHFL